VFGAVLAACLWYGVAGWCSAPGAVAATAGPGQGGGILIRTPPGQPLTAEERGRVAAALLASPSVSERIKGHKVRVLSVTHGYETGAAGGKDDQYRATVILFDYTTGKATRFALDLPSGEIVGEQLLRGRPQASEEELQLAARIVQADAELARLLSPSGRLMGGFVVNGPSGSSPDHRFIQLRIVTDDLRDTKRVVTVDLTDEVVASK
jgi:hypothetical protein